VPPDPVPYLEGDDSNFSLHPMNLEQAMEFLLLRPFGVKSLLWDMKEIPQQ